VQCVCELDDHIERRVPSARLESRDVGAVEACPFGELFLRPAGVAPQSAHAISEGPTVNALLVRRSPRLHMLRVC
jgi:hypothetical protein